MGTFLRLRIAFRFMIPAALVVLMHGAAFAEEAPSEDRSSRFSVVEENDYFASHDDRDYTQGIRFGYLFPAIRDDAKWGAPYTWLALHSPVFDGLNRRRKTQWIVVGQSLFTPAATNVVRPLPRDRPYGAWLYTGVSLLQETQEAGHRRLENVELLVGVVGPLALGAITQNDFHQFIGVKPSRGWKNQIHNEPGGMIVYERKWKFTQPVGEYLAIDAIPELGASLGNVFLYGQASGMLRIGHNMDADYGPTHIRPGLSGTGWFDVDEADGVAGWYLYVGAQGRIVGRNIFLDGNTIADSPSVDKRLFVEDFVAGAALLWQSVRVDFSVTERTKEFFGQPGSPNRFGGVSISFNL